MFKIRMRQVPGARGGRLHQEQAGSMADRHTPRAMCRAAPSPRPPKKKKKKRMRQVRPLINSAVPSGFLGSDSPPLKHPELLKAVILNALHIPALLYLCCPLHLLRTPCHPLRCSVNITSSLGNHS